MESLARLDALLELLGSKWLEALRSDRANKNPLAFSRRGRRLPDTVNRLARLTRGASLTATPAASGMRSRVRHCAPPPRRRSRCWERAFGFGQLAEDIAIEARLALTLTDEVAALDARVALLFGLVQGDGPPRSGVAARSGATVAELGAEQRFIHAGRPQTNGCVERVQGTILAECWKPSFAR